MSTSADPRPVRLRAVAYADPVAQHLVERVQEEYVVRYGGRDAAVVDPAEFSPPLGLFLVAEVQGRPAGCGGWRSCGDGVAEVKRMYVDPAFRRRGIAALVLAELERSAAAAGHRQLVLNSGDRQPEALALYARAGYVPVAGYGVYADEPGAVFLGKDLDGRLAGEEDDAWAS
jgi:GNAT superfamily N-acetyltransferase